MKMARGVGLLALPVVVGPPASAPRPTPATTPAPALPVDVDNGPRPKGAGYDIGAHEVQ